MTKPKFKKDDVIYSELENRITVIQKVMEEGADYLVDTGHRVFGMTEFVLCEYALVHVIDAANEKIGVL